MHLPARITIAAYAYGTNDHVVVIRALDDFVDTGAVTEELQWLADAPCFGYAAPKPQCPLLRKAFGIDPRRPTDRARMLAS
ncbi:hypothetical protein [Lichenihabitans psoromatis]|uniref:hypothetical protein n=1 Tax=Lichenihabitans psoromatis TaxID=2528642 RepID=UPI001035FA6D|nr:hypothetical protein [Lichenihabitans psoromatis]